MRPPELKNNDQIALVSPARKITYEEVAFSLKIFKQWGLQPVFDERLFRVDNQFGGSDDERIELFQWALDNPEIKAIVCVRGGYGITRIIDRIDFSGFKNSPKWICGYSDVTALLSHIFNFGIESIHSTMPMLFARDSENSLKSLKEILFGGSPVIKADPHQLNIPGICEGRIVGGNLSILNTIIATSSDFIPQGTILFIEDIDEYLYNIDRMMVHLKRAGKLKGIVGLIVGHMTDMKDNTVPFGANANQIIFNWVKDLNIPVCFGFPVGHEENNIAIPVGRVARLTINSTGSELSFSDINNPRPGQVFA